jgi:hypothetical protein
MVPQTVRAAPRDADGGPARECMLGGLPLSHTVIPEPKQGAACGPSPDAIAAADEFVLDELYRILGLIASYATSGLEAARRGDVEEIRLRLRVQLRDCFRHAVEVHNLLSAGQRKGGVA